MAGKSLPLLWAVVLTLLPIVVILVLMAWKQVAADVSGIAGWLLTLLIAFVFFNTSIEVGLRSSLAGYMIWVLARGSALAVGAFYPFISAFMGLFGGFISGSEASTIAMFTKYHLLTSRMLNVNALVVTAATAIGGGLASVISPAKLQNAAATIDALGIESRVIRTAFLISVLITVVAAMIALIMA